MAHDPNNVFTRYDMVRACAFSAVRSWQAGRLSVDPLAPDRPPSWDETQEIIQFIDAAIGYQGGDASFDEIHESIKEILAI